MNIYVFTNKEKVLKNIFPKDTQYIGFAKLPAYLPADAEMIYIDVTGLSEGKINKILLQIKKICKNIPWGLIDPKGNIEDPALIFFEGACDYIGQTFLKTHKSLNIKRIKSAVLWHAVIIKANKKADSNTGSKAGNSETATEKEESGFFKSKTKLPPTDTFQSWKKMISGKTMPFYILHCSLNGKTSLEARLEEKAVIKVHKRLCNYLSNIFSQGDGLLWMDSGKDCIFLFPPIAKNAGQAIEACIRAIISAPLVTLETLALTLPVNFTFALHYGSITYRPPGKTGTVISDAVNTVFHLGTKKCESGRLTITNDIPNGSIPKSLQDCFVQTGDFEGRSIWHTRKFEYEKPWT